MRLVASRPESTAEKGNKRRGLVEEAQYRILADNGGGVFWAGTTGSSTSFVDTIVAKNSGFSVGPDGNNPAGTFTDSGGNLIGVSGAGGGNTGFTAATTLDGFHAFRHANATLMSSFGAPLKLRQQRLGHVDGSPVTETVYTHVISEDGKRIARQLGDAVRGVLDAIGREKGNGLEGASSKPFHIN